MSKTDILIVAKAFLSDIGHNPSITIKSAVTLTKKGVPFVHVINADNGVGFVIISADSCYTPVLAYNVKDNFSLDSKSLNAGIAFWFNSHSNSLDFIKTTKSAYTDSIKYHNKALWQELGKKYNLNGSSSAITSTTNGSTIRVSTNQFFPAPPPYYVTTVTTYQSPTGPFSGVAYDQAWPYNDDCPTAGLLMAQAPMDYYYNGHWAVGCGPVAVAQVMAAWRLPDSKYDWTQMNNLSGQGIHYIPLLLANLGQQAGSIYNFFSTGDTFTEDYGDMDALQANGFVTPSYTTPVQNQSANPINGVSYGNLLASEILIYKRPCIITATTGESNLFLGLLYAPYTDFHTWVCEGDQRWTTVTTQTITYYYYVGTDPALHTNQTVSSYSTYADYLYMNWGWGGSGNGFYYNSTVNYTQPVAYQGGPNVNLNFLDFQTVIYNIHP